MHIRSSRSRSERRRRTDFKSLRVLAPGWTPPANGPVGVVAVEVVSSHVLRWTFSSPITAVGANATSLTATDNGEEFMSPDSVTRQGSGSLLATYGGLTFTAAGAKVGYAVPGPSAGLTFANGPLGYPQSGQGDNPLTATQKPAKKARRKIKAAKLTPPAAIPAPSRKAA